jgi:hypothetical protein
VLGSATQIPFVNDIDFNRHDPSPFFFNEERREYKKPSQACQQDSHEIHTRFFIRSPGP